MKRLLLILILLTLVAQPCLAAINVFTRSVDTKKTYKNAYRWTGKTKDWLLDWAQEVEDRLDGTTLNQSFSFSPTDTVPDACEGRVYYDDTSNMLTVYNGSAWITLGTSASGDSLDTAYNNGAGITVDGDALTLTTADTKNNVCLAIVHEEATNDNDALTIVCNTADYTGDGISIDGVAGSTDIRGDSWNVSQAGLITCVGITTSGEIQTGTTTDVLFNAAKDVSWDATSYMLLFEDDAILGIGGSHDGAADMTFAGDGTDVYVEVASEDGADLVFGATNAFDILIHNDAADSLITFDQSAELLALNGWDLRIMDDDDIVFGDDVSDDSFTIGFDESSDNLIIHATHAHDKVQIGDGSTDTDFKLMTNTGTVYALWDASGEELIFDYADLKINDQSQIEFADSGDAVDWAIDCATGETLLFTPTEDTDDQTINFGNATYTSDFRLFGASASTIVFDASADEMLTTDYHIRMGDDDLIRFGADGDFSITCSGATQLDVNSLLTDETAVIDIGASASGIDVNWFEGQAGDFVLFDASRGDVLFDDVNLVMMDDTRLQLGDSNDFYITCSGATQLDIVSLLTDETAVVDIGVDAAGIDVNLFAAASGDFIRFDSSVADLIVEDCNIHIMDATAGSGTSTLIFGDSDDIVIQFDGTNSDLDITGDGLEIAFGATAAGLDIIWWEGVTGDFVIFDESRGDVLFDDVNLVMMDDTQLAFGDSNDFYIINTGATQLDIVSLLTDETAAIDFGADQAGIDVNLFGTTSSASVLFDSSADKVIFEAIDVHVMDDDLIIFGDGSDATLQYDEDSNDAVQWTGTVFGAKTKVLLYGLLAYDLAMEANSITVLALMSGCTYVADGNHDDPNTHFLLPTAVAGYEYTFIDANATANHQAWVTASGSDTIDGGTANKSMRCTGTDPGESITLVAIDDVRWVITDVNGTWAHDNN